MVITSPSSACKVIITYDLIVNEDVIVNIEYLLFLSSNTSSSTSTATLWSLPLSTLSSTLTNLDPISSFPDVDEFSGFSSLNFPTRVWTSFDLYSLSLKATFKVGDTLPQIADLTSESLENYYWDMILQLGYDRDITVEI